MNVLVQAYTELNVGDDLFLHILKNRYPNTTFALLSKNHHLEYDQFEDFYTPSVSLLERIIRKLISFFNVAKAEKYLQTIKDRKLRNKYDAYLIIGGSMFMQHSKVGYVENCYKYYIETMRHRFVIGANFGPYKDQEFLDFFSKQFKKCDSITFRDSYSAKLFPHYSNIKSKPDIVFQFKPQNVEKIPNSVGISVIDLSARTNLNQYDECYVSFLTTITNLLLKDGKIVYLYSFCKAEGDEKTIDRILEKIDHHNLKTVRYGGDLLGFLDCFGKMETIYATRFHAMVLGLVYDQKIVPIIYSEKMTQVLDDIKFTGKIVEIENISQESPTECINCLNEYNYILSDRIRKESVEMFMDFDEFVSSHS